MTALHSHNQHPQKKQDFSLELTENCLKEVKNFLHIIEKNVKPYAAEQDKYQHILHGYAWYQTYYNALYAALEWAKDLKNQNRFGEIENLILQIGYGEYIAQIVNGISMSQSEIIRCADFDIDYKQIYDFTQNDAISYFLTQGNIQENRDKLIALILQDSGNITIGDSGLDETLQMTHEQFYRFVKDKVEPHAHEWHSKDELIPLEIIEEMAELGVFGLTIPEEFGGFGMGKIAMCVVSEALSRGYIGVGSLGTRSEIAAELILCGGTQEQKEYYLPKLAAAEILPTAVFTEPNTGSDLGSLKTKAIKQGDDYIINGNKTWITHAARADLMTVLARTDSNTTDWRGLSMFLVEKQRGNETNPFPDSSIKGGEIEVLGYRGMKEYELALTDLKVPAKQLLGGSEGEGFKQLMKTFESARIQTAARAVGVAQNAFDLGLRYAKERIQFGKAIVHFPRVYNKIVSAAVEIMFARQLTYFAARQKDTDIRCDVEAGMAKLLAAKIAWSTADCALQIHGGNGFALEYQISRVLCDARILGIFEGASEIQAQVIAKRLL
jgi:(2S)-methylsuccinyl-CoA dehydrogenase